ncbi:hypothetical protein AURDEDRAFT_136992 [Auricularia subglabra TFB-10046 SS5]|nr:hypothetical protein AURDEDRAFT_136992 [Auricularia subglabra TFB-10046 SS5]
MFHAPHHPHPPPFPPPPPQMGFEFPGQGFPPGPHPGPHGHPHPHPHPHPHGGPHRGGPHGLGRGGLGRGGAGWRHHPRPHPYGFRPFGDLQRGRNAPGDDNEPSHAEKIAQELALEIIERAKLDPLTTDVLDFGFDTNGFFASRILQPHVRALVGAAIDARAVDAYDTYANQSNLGPEQMRAVRVPHMGDLGALGGRLFDVILVAQPIEQRPDVAAAIPALAQALRPGGMLFIVSLDMSASARAGPFGFGFGFGPGFGLGAGFGGPAEEPNDHLHPDRERIQALLSDAGLVTADLARVDSYGFASNEPGRLFVARGVKLQDVENESTVSSEGN